MANIYKVELEDDRFEILEAETDGEVLIEASRIFEFFYNVIKLDQDYNEIEVIF